MAASEQSMAEGEADPGTARLWDSAQVPRAARFEYYRDAICAAFMPLAPERPRRGGDFRARVSSHPLGPIVVNHVRADAHMVVKTSREIARSAQDCVYLNLKRDGMCGIAQRGSDVLLRPGEVGLFDDMTPFILDHEARPVLEVVSLMIPHEALRAASPAFDPSRLPMRLTDHPRFGRMIASSCAMVADAADLDATLSHPLAELVIGLVAAALSEDTGAPRHRETQADALRIAARRLIGENARAADFGVTDLARRLGVSPRYVQMLFARAGTTASAAMLAARLDIAAAELRQPSRAGDTIAAIAYGAGFADLSHFNRAFRARFGCTPGTWRAGAA